MGISANKSIDESKANEPAPKYPNWRLGLVSSLLMFGFFVILVRLFIVQAIDGEKYREISRRQHEFSVELKPKRGIIYDRAMNKIAATMQTVSYAADPNMLEKKQEVIKILENITGDSSGFWRQKFSQAKGSFLWLLRSGYWDTHLLDKMEDPGLIKIREPRRHYQYGNAGAQVVGCTSVDNIGLSGLELAYNDLLQGEKGKKILLRDGRGTLRPSAELPTILAVNGKSIITTLDVELQRIAEFELRNGVLESNGEGGTIVAIQPKTGEILAVASIPSFNPNFPGNAKPEEMRLRAITDMYEPGSTFKIVAASAVLEENAVKISDSFDAEGGSMHIGNYEIKDSHPNGILTFSQAMEQSSNVAFAKIAQKVSDDKFYKYARDFGFGIPLGVDFPGEVRGILKKPRQFEPTTKLFMAFGYELAATALQVANAYSTIANGGVMMRPYLVKSIVDENGVEQIHNEPQKIRRAVSEETAKTLTTMLVGTVENGTGSQAKIQGLHIAGKTGTAQQLVNGEYSKASYTASFVGFFPSENPEVVLLVMIDRPKSNIYGGMTAAPIFRKIVSRWIGSKRLKVPTTVENTTDSSQFPVMPQLRGISTDIAKKRLGELRLRVHANREGIVIAQTPSAGTRIKPNSLTTILAHAEKNPFDSTHTAFPDVKGLTLRRAFAVLHAHDAYVTATGSGRVIQQTWRVKNGKKHCTLVAKQSSQAQ